MVTVYAILNYTVTIQTIKYYRITVHAIKYYSISSLIRDKTLYNHRTTNETQNALLENYGFLSYHDKTYAVESDVKPHFFLPLFKTQSKFNLTKVFGL